MPLTEVANQWRHHFRALLWVYQAPSEVVGLLSKTLPRSQGARSISAHEGNVKITPWGPSTVLEGSAEDRKLRGGCLAKPGVRS